MKLLYPEAEHIKILGVTFDKRFCFSRQLTSIQDRAKVRLGVLSKLAGLKWGTDTIIAKLTGDALVVSLIRYALTVTGSGRYEN